MAFKRLIHSVFQYLLVKEIIAKDTAKNKQKERDCPFSSKSTYNKSHNKTHYKQSIWCPSLISPMMEYPSCKHSGCCCYKVSYYCIWGKYTQYYSHKKKHKEEKLCPVSIIAEFCLLVHAHGPFPQLKRSHTM